MTKDKPQITTNANDPPKGLAFCKCVYRGAGLLQVKCFWKREKQRDVWQTQSSRGKAQVGMECLQVLLTMVTTFNVLSMLYMLCRSDTRRTLTCYGAEELEELSW